MTLHKKKWHDIQSLICDHIVLPVSEAKLAQFLSNGASTPSLGPRADLQKSPDKLETSTRLPTTSCVLNYLYLMRICAESFITVPASNGGAHISDHPATSNVSRYSIQQGLPQNKHGQRGHPSEGTFCSLRGWPRNPYQHAPRAVHQASIVDASCGQLLSRQGHFACKSSHLRT